MFSWFRRWFNRPTTPVSPTVELREQVAAADLTLQKKLLEATLSVYDSYVDPREPYIDDVDFFYPIVNENLPVNIDNRKRGEALPLYLTEYGLKLIRDQARRQAAFNEFAINAMSNRVSFIVGKGFNYRVGRKRGHEAEGIEPGEVDWLTGSAQKVLDEFCDRNDWGELEQEIVWRCDRDGEAFVRFFSDERGNIDARIIEPEHVKCPAANREPQDEFGVRTEPEDICKVVGYWVVEDPNVSWDPTLVPADEILHVKLNTDRNAKRGVSSLFPVRKNLERAEKLLRNMSMMVQVQSTYAVIRKHAGASVSAISAFRDAKSSLQVQDPISGKTINVGQLQPGSIIDTTPGTEYEFPAASVNSGAFVQVLQAELRAIASRFTMPEYMLGSDASNANYSSTMVAESPAVKNFERMQNHFADKFGQGGYRHSNAHIGVMWRVLRAAVDADRIPEEALEKLEIVVVGPSLVVRDKNQETQRLSTLSQQKLLSKQQWSQEEGLDYARMQSEIKKEEPQGPSGGNPLAAMMGG